MLKWNAKENYTRFSPLHADNSSSSPPRRRENISRHFFPCSSIHKKESLCSMFHCVSQVNWLIIYQTQYLMCFPSLSTPVGFALNWWIEASELHSLLRWEKLSRGRRLRNFSIKDNNSVFSLSSPSTQCDDYKAWAHSKGNWKFLVELENCL